MKRIRLSIGLYWIVVISLCSVRVESISMCTRISLELGEAEFETLCDLEFCTCHDPYGRIRCVCPSEIQDELIIRSKGSCAVPEGATSLSIDNCKKVTVIQNAFEERDVKDFHLSNVKEISLNGRIFPSNGPEHVVSFANSTIPDIPSFTFTGNIHSVSFDNCYVGMIRAFAFSSIHGADSIAFRDTNIANVEAQSFKNFPTNKFLIVECQFNVIPSRFVLDVKVENVFKIDSTFVDEIRTLGFKIHNPKKMIVTNSMINKVHAEAFKVVSKGDIVFEGNTLSTIDNEAFRGVTTDRILIQQGGKPKFKFQNQTMTHLQKKSLYFNRSEFEVHLSKLMIDEACTCDGIMSWREMITIGKKPIESIEIELEPIWCHMDDKKEGNFDYVPAREFYKEHCTKLTSSIYFFVIIISTTAVCIAIAISIIVCVFRRRKKWQPVPVSANNATGNSPKKAKETKNKGKKEETQEVAKLGATKAIIVPDGRTYKETEFHIIVEKAEPLDEECIPYTVVRDRSRSQIN